LGWGSDHCTAPPYKLQHKHRINADTPSSLERDSDPEPWCLNGWRQYNLDRSADVVIGSRTDLFSWIR
jgi:hypothetical protein